jgi:hypothetical protein
MMASPRSPVGLAFAPLVSHQPDKKPDHTSYRGVKHDPIADPLWLGQILPTDKKREADDQRPDNEGVGEQIEACRKAVYKPRIVVRPHRLSVDKIKSELDSGLTRTEAGRL